VKDEELDILEDNNLADEIVGDWLILFWKPTVLLIKEIYLLKLKLKSKSKRISLDSVITRKLDRVSNTE